MAFPVLSALSAPTAWRLRRRPVHLRRTPGTASTTSMLGVSHLYLSPSHSVPESSPRLRRHRPTLCIGGTRRGGRPPADCPMRPDRGMGLVVDIVPNHVGCSDPSGTGGGWDVLRHGRRSPYAAYFDIDHSADDSGRIVLPVLGSDTDVEQLRVDGDVLRLGDRTFPIAPGTADDGAGGREVHERQHYRLTGWRTGPCGYRRFFRSPNLPVSVRRSRPCSTSATEVARWFTEALVDGVRIDHPDGLADPAGTWVRLRELAGPGGHGS